jgi:uncharacterized protein
MLYVLFYQPAEGLMDRAAELFPAHSARLDEFHSRGDLFMVGPFGDPERQGSMSVFRTREAAEEFVRDDPFVVNDVVQSWEIREWDEAYSAS